MRSLWLHETPGNLFSYKQRQHVITSSCFSIPPFGIKLFVVRYLLIHLYSWNACTKENQYTRMTVLYSCGDRNWEQCQHSFINGFTVYFGKFSYVCIRGVVVGSSCSQLLVDQTFIKFLLSSEGLLLGSCNHSKQLVELKACKQYFHKQSKCILHQGLLKHVSAT